jgi:glutamate N-acetyltransferase/amino-acid N-acetyltransferase
VRFRPELVRLDLGEVRVVRNGAVCKYDLKAAKAAVAGPTVSVSLDLNAGEEEATVWTCDLTEAYVRINARYHT